MPPRRNELELEKVLEKMISRLQEQGIISPNADPKELLEKTMENLTNALGKDNLPSGDALKDPMILMKLTLSVIATHKNPANAPIPSIFKLETETQLQELTKEMQLDPQILKFMQLCLGEKKEELSPEDPDKNKCVCLYDACGTLLQKYETVFSSGDLPGAKVQTKEQLLAMASVGENLKECIDDDIRRLANPSPKPSPY